MKITKFGHCCLLIEEGDIRILTDPGNYTEIPHVENIDVILISHEHGDHIDADTLKSLLTDNPTAQIITHEGVGRVLDEAGIAYTLIHDAETQTIKGIDITSYGTEHACVYHDLPVVQNTGFLIAKKLFFPGDSFFMPSEKVEILALPVAAPWLKLEESIDYAKKVAPKVVFPIHDGMLRQDHRITPTRKIPQAILDPLDIEYRDMGEGSVEEF